MFPGSCCRWTLYALFDRTGEILSRSSGLNTHGGGVIFAYMGGIALHVWTIKGYFETIDGSLEEAALDGATPLAGFPPRAAAAVSCRFWQSCLFCRSSRPSPRCQSPRCCCCAM